MGNCGNDLIITVGGCSPKNTSASILTNEYIWNGGDSNIFILPMIPKGIHQVFLNGQKLRNTEGVDYTRFNNKVTVNYQLFPVTDLELNWVVTISYFK